MKLVFGAVISEILVVTFAPMYFDYEEDKYWGEKALTRNGFSSAGFVCRTGCWFPREDIEKLGVVLLERAASFRKIVLYGFSMGAYAAVKYSRMLRASCTIALGPQFSIDRRDCGEHNQWAFRFFNHALNGQMAVSSSDVSGRIYLFYDPYEPGEKWNCAMVSRAATGAAEVQHVHVPNIGHNTMDVYAKTKNLSVFINSCERADMAALLKLTAENRRASPRRVFNVLARVRSRYPGKIQAMFQRYSNRLTPRWLDEWRRLPPLPEGAAPAGQPG